MEDSFVRNSTSDLVYYGNNDDTQCNLKRTSVQPLLEDDVESEDSEPQPSTSMGGTGFTVNEEDAGRKLPQYVAALAATGGALAAGTILGWSSPASSRLVNVTISEREYPFDVSEEQFSWIGACVTLGAAFICFPIGQLANWFGRKWTMISLVIPFTIGWALVIWAQNIAMMYAGRVLLGIAGGAFCVTAPMYTGEIAQSEVRGSLGSYFQLMVTIGILFVYAVGAGVSVKWLSIICGIIPLAFGVIFFFMPESPTYLVSKGNEGEALKSLKWLRGTRYDSQHELTNLIEENNSMKSNATNLLKALGRKASLKGMGITMGLMFFQQMSGINAVIFYTTDIFAAADTGIDASLATIIVGVIQVVATFISSLVVDKLGRRMLLLFSSLLMGVCLAGLGLYFYLQSAEKDVSNLGWLPIVALCIYIVVFSLGFGPIPWLMCGELFAPDIKGFLGALAGTTNWILAFIITKFFVNVVDAIQRGPTFWLFMGFCLVGFVFVLIFVPETKGKSFAEIQMILSGEEINTQQSQGEYLPQQSENVKSSNVN